MQGLRPGASSQGFSTWNYFAIRISTSWARNGIFLAFSLVFSVAGIFSMDSFWQPAPVPLGVDFRGGTLVYVKFTQTPNIDDIRSAMDQRRTCTMPAFRATAPRRTTKC